MAATRASTGHSKPRVAATVSTTPERKRTTTTTRAKPATTTTKKTGAGLTKKKAPATDHKRKAGLSDKLEGAVKKAEGAVTRKPGKKAAGARQMKGTDGKNNRTAK